MLSWLLAIFLTQNSTNKWKEWFDTYREHKNCGTIPTSNGRNSKLDCYVDEDFDLSFSHKYLHDRTSILMYIFSYNHNIFWVPNFMSEQDTNRNHSFFYWNIILCSVKVVGEIWFSYTTGSKVLSKLEQNVRFSMKE